MSRRFQSQWRGEGTPTQALTCTDIRLAPSQACALQKHGARYRDHTVSHGEGRKALFMGEHAAYFEGQPEEVGRFRLEKLVEHAVQERFVYRHTWTLGDLLMWDNRCLLHRANPNFDAARFPRVLQRTCLRGTAPN
jgi:alpha-ketoglutarate-dependent taurine dioxygenase